MIEQLFGVLPAFFKDEDELRKLWANPETHIKLLQQLGEKGYGNSQLADIQKIIAAENSDIFDVLRYVAYARAPIARRERADLARPSINQSYSDKQQTFLNFVLSHYVDQGVQELEPAKLSRLLEPKYRSLSDARLVLGSNIERRDLFRDFQPLLYASTNLFRSDPVSCQAPAPVQNLQTPRHHRRFRFHNLGGLIPQTCYSINKPHNFSVHN